MPTPAPQLQGHRDPRVVHNPYRVHKVPLKSTSGGLRGQWHLPSPWLKKSQCQASHPET